MKIIQKDMHVNTIKHILRNKLQVEKIYLLKKLPFGQIQQMLG